MPNNKFPSRGSLTKEVLWEALKTPLISSFKPGIHKDELSNSQKQAVIRLINKKKIKMNWRLISLLNVDLKILSKALKDCIKKFLTFLIWSN